uniref:bis(5'-adenosyl)-triphosphatase enpp4-like n=1 Tax=Myxine glutinosa TaxID=7769 RepID=UPI00358E329C
MALQIKGILILLFFQFVEIFCWKAFPSVSSPTTGGKRNPPTGRHPLLLVSFDGFRWDYLSHFHLPTFAKLQQQWAHVEKLQPAFISKTFPNHNSIMTGLFVESHGIVANSMYDIKQNTYFTPGRHNGTGWWDDAEPLWLTNQRSGGVSGSAMWPGTGVRVRGAEIACGMRYDRSVSFEDRARHCVACITDKKANFVTLYWEEPDRSGHRYGPRNSTVMQKVLSKVDDHLAFLLSHLGGEELLGHINVIVTSDHGMAGVESVIELDSCLDPQTYLFVNNNPIAGVWPRHDLQEVYNLLTKCSKYLRVYKKEEIPSEYHYKDHRRIPPILLVAEQGWGIVQNATLNKSPVGEHGYNNSLSAMQTILFASGPDLQTGIKIPTMRNIDIYPLLCHLLGIHPQPNNGSLMYSRFLLASEKIAPGSSHKTLTAVAIAGIVILVIVCVMYALCAIHNKSSPYPHNSTYYYSPYYDECSSEEDLNN